MVADFFVDRENMNDYKYMCVYKNIHKYVFLNIKNDFLHCVCVCVYNECYITRTIWNFQSLSSYCHKKKRNQLCSIV